MYLSIHSPDTRINGHAYCNMYLSMYTCICVSVHIYMYHVSVYTYM